MMNRAVVALVGIACVTPVAELAIILILLFTDATRHMTEVIAWLLGTVVLLWLPCVGYLLYRIAKSDEPESSKTAWTMSLLILAPFAAPVVWYRFCFKRLGDQ